MSQESLRCPGTFNTAVGASLGQEHTAGLGWGQNGQWGWGALPLCPWNVMLFTQSLVLKQVDLAGIPALLFILRLWTRH